MRSEGEARRSPTGRTGSVPARRRVGLRKESGDLLSTLAAVLTVHPDPGDLRLRRRRDPPEGAPVAAKPAIRDHGAAGAVVAGQVAF